MHIYITGNRNKMIFLVLVKVGTNGCLLHKFDCVNHIIFMVLLARIRSRNIEIIDIGLIEIVERNHCLCSFHLCPLLISSVI